MAQNEVKMERNPGHHGACWGREGGVTGVKGGVGTSGGVSEGFERVLGGLLVSFLGIARLRKQQQRRK